MLVWDTATVPTLRVRSFLLRHVLLAVVAASTGAQLYDLDVLCGCMVAVVAADALLAFLRRQVFVALVARVTLAPHDSLDVSPHRLFSVECPGSVLSACYEGEVPGKYPCKMTACNRTGLLTINWTAQTKRPVHMAVLDYSRAS